MSEEQINIAIAKACGWIDTDIVNCGGKLMYGQTEVPDYCNDLNAMHEAEKTLDYNMICDMEDSVGFRFAIKPFHATARQRAEAFLRTLGKWEEAAE